ncbi:hypothetical protein M3Y99_00036100 [Aphelenchoides fujianensis]|nr:hypothetical protein M3Y99_00036100 [Aphelenchoides fujianensis]
MSSAPKTPQKMVFTPRWPAHSSASSANGKIQQEVRTALAESLAYSPVKKTGAEKPQRWIVRCASCREVIERTDALKDNVIFSLNRFWHKDHFSCINCEAPIGTRKLEFRADRNEPNRPICLDCHMDAHHPPCASCKKPLTERALQAFGQLFHKGCFLCARCRSPLPDGEYYVHNNKPFDCDCYFLTKYEKVLNNPVGQSPAANAYSSDSSSSLNTTTLSLSPKTNEKAPHEGVNSQEKVEEGGLFFLPPKPMPRDSRTAANEPLTPANAVVPPAGKKAPETSGPKEAAAKNS